MNVVKIEAEFDLDAIKDEIQASKKITGNEAYFKQLARIQSVKNQIKLLEDQLITVDQEAKGLINNKAKALFGDNWQVIKGDNFKITRSQTGDVYVITDAASPKFVKVKKSVDTKAVEEYVTQHSKLPKGIEVNDQRGESIRISVSDENS